MNNDKVINRIAHITGHSRKEVLTVLKNFGMLPEKSRQTIKKEN